MEDGYGASLKEDARRFYGASIGFSGRGEMIPNDDSYCEIDPDGKDKFGIPVLRFHWKWSDHEKKQAVHMQKTFAQIIESRAHTDAIDRKIEALLSHKSQLPDPRISRTCNASEATGRHRRRGGSQIDMIERVEELRAEL